MHCWCWHQSGGCVRDQPSATANILSLGFHTSGNEHCNTCVIPVRERTEPCTGSKQTDKTENGAHIRRNLNKPATFDVSPESLQLKPGIALHKENRCDWIIHIEIIHIAYQKLHIPVSAHAAGCCTSCHLRHQQQNIKFIRFGEL